MLAESGEQVEKVDREEADGSIEYDGLDEGKVEGNCGGKQENLSTCCGPNVRLSGVGNRQFDSVDEILTTGTDGCVRVVLHFGAAESEFVGLSVQQGFFVVGRISVHSIEAQFVVSLLLTHLSYLIYCCGQHLLQDKYLPETFAFTLLPFVFSCVISRDNIAIKLLKQQVFDSIMTKENLLSSKSNQKSSKQPQKHSHNHQNVRPKSASSSRGFDMTKSVMYSTLNNHPDECLCKDCDCGRHLCKIGTPTPSLTLSTTYKNDYPRRQPNRYQPPSRPLSARQPEAPLLNGSSTYLEDFTILKADPLSRPKPEDLLRCRGGHQPKLTSYKQEYPGHRGKNQHVPMNPELFRGGLDFANGGSTYSKEFGHQRGKSAEVAKPPDQFSMTGSWFGKSSYKDQYQNPKNHVSKSKGDKLEQSLELTKSEVSNTSQKNPSSHFKTTYASEFRGNKRAVCPAALKVVEIESTLSKSAFKENSAFKGFDSHYQSLAKHGNQF